jgi:hypothetical protein
MLQLLYLDVSKVDWVLSLSSAPSVAQSVSALVGHSYAAAAWSFRIEGVTRPSPLVAWAT